MLYLKMCFWRENGKIRMAVNEKKFRWCKIVILSSYFLQFENMYLPSMDQFQLKSNALVGNESKCHLVSTVETIKDRRNFCKSPILGCMFLDRSFDNLDQHMRSSISTRTETSLMGRITRSILMAKDTFRPEKKRLGLKGVFQIWSI